MFARAPLAAGLLLTSGLLVAGTATGASAAVCDAYSGNCTTPPATSPPGGGGGGGGTGGTGGTGGESGGTGGNGASEGGDLPFTGGEAVLMSVLGLGALAGGTALVVAGRRRSAGELA